MKRILSFSLSVFVWMCGYAQYRTDTAISYSESKEPYAVERCVLDIHYNPDSTLLPVVVWFHGGGLTAGNRYIPQELQNSGYVVIAPNYRLLPKATISESIDDAAAAVAWAFAHATEYGGDPSRIVVAGHSAGGYLTSMIGLDKSWLHKYGIDADSIATLVPYSGQVITHFALRQSQGLTALQPTIDEFAPLYHVRKDAPPYVIITGDRDMELNGRYEENLYMWRMMKLVGHPDVSIYRLDGYNHGDMVRPAHHILKSRLARLKKH